MLPILSDIGSWQVAFLVAFLINSFAQSIIFLEDHSLQDRLPSLILFCFGVTTLRLFWMAIVLICPKYIWVEYAVDPIQDYKNNKLNQVKCVKQ